jgi:hypothetical protein
MLTLFSTDIGSDTLGAQLSKAAGSAHGIVNPQQLSFAQAEADNVFELQQVHSSVGATSELECSKSIQR